VLGLGLLGQGPVLGLGLPGLLLGRPGPGQALGQAPGQALGPSATARRRAAAAPYHSCA
jgi:hypothetical protein